MLGASGQRGERASRRQRAAGAYRSQKYEAVSENAIATQIWPAKGLLSTVSSALIFDHL
jgi:hypothetical protein